jgi:hypothetical protein
VLPVPFGLQGAGEHHGLVDEVVTAKPSGSSRVKYATSHNPSHLGHPHFQGGEPLVEVAAPDAQVAVGQLEAAGQLALGLPVVEGRPGDTPSSLHTSPTVSSRSGELAMVMHPTSEAGVASRAAGAYAHVVTLAAQGYQALPATDSEMAVRASSLRADRVGVGHGGRAGLAGRRGP